MLRQQGSTRLILASSQVAWSDDLVRLVEPILAIGQAVGPAVEALGACEEIAAFA